MSSSLPFSDSARRPPMQRAGASSDTDGRDSPATGDGFAVGRMPGGGSGLNGDGRRGGEAYLESAIATASPARLRLMVIERAVEVARHLGDHWRQTHGRGTNEHSLKLLELLSELLSGVTDQQAAVCRSVADLYVFLCQHLIAAEEHGDAEKIDEIRLVLEVEAETWRMVCARDGGAARAATGAAGSTAANGMLTGNHANAHPGNQGGLNLQG